MMPVWLLYVKQSADFSAASKSLRSPMYSHYLRHGFWRTFGDNYPGNRNYNTLTQPRHKDDKVSACAVRASIGHLRAVSLSWRPLLAG
jgi:hypothetical protein